MDRGEVGVTQQDTAGTDTEVSACTAERATSAHVDMQHMDREINGTQHVTQQDTAVTDTEVSACTAEREASAHVDMQHMDRDIDGAQHVAQQDTAFPTYITTIFKIMTNLQSTLNGFEKSVASLRMTPINLASTRLSMTLHRQLQIQIMRYRLKPLHYMTNKEEITAMIYWRVNYMAFASMIP